MIEGSRKLGNVRMLGVSFLSVWSWFGLGMCELKGQEFGLRQQRSEVVGRKEFQRIECENLLGFESCSSLENIR